MKKQLKVWVTDKAKKKLAKFSNGNMSATIELLIDTLPLKVK